MLFCRFCVRTVRKFLFSFGMDIVSNSPIENFGSLATFWFTSTSLLFRIYFVSFSVEVIFRISLSTTTNGMASIMLCVPGVDFAIHFIPFLLIGHLLGALILLRWFFRDISLYSLPSFFVIQI